MGCEDWDQWADDDRNSLVWDDDAIFGPSDITCEVSCKLTAQQHKHGLAGDAVVKLISCGPASQAKGNLTYIMCMQEENASYLQPESDQGQSNEQAIKQVCIWTSNFAAECIYVLEVAREDSPTSSWHACLRWLI